MNIKKNKILILLLMMFLLLIGCENKTNEHTVIFRTSFSEDKIIIVEQGGKINSKDIPSFKDIPVSSLYNVVGWADSTNTDEVFDFENTLINDDLKLILKEELRNSENEPFFMPIEDVFTITGKGTCATGMILRGSVKVGEVYELSGIRNTKKLKLIEIESNQTSVNEAKVSDSVGLCFNIDGDEIERGQVLIAPNSVPLKNKFNADIYFFKDGKENAKISLPSKELKFYYYTNEYEANITTDSNVSQIENHKKYIASVELPVNLPIEKGHMFIIRKDNITIGLGFIK